MLLFSQLSYVIVFSIELILFYFPSKAGLVLDRFQVSVLPTDASERACLRGQLQLVIFTRGVGVARVGDFECFLLWPIAFIRQYRHESVKNKNYSTILSQTNKSDKRQTVVTLEVGRYVITFLTFNFDFKHSNKLVIFGHFSKKCI